MGFEIDKRALDDYIMGVNIRDEDNVRHICPKCKVIKFVPMVFDMGGWFYNNDDEAWCEKCQVEMDIKEDDQ